MYNTSIELRDSIITRVFEYTLVEATKDEPKESRMIHIEGRYRTGTFFVKLLEIGNKHLDLSSLNKRFNTSTVVNKIERFLI